MPDEFVVRRQPMICGSAEAEDREYTAIEGESGRIWLVADQPNAADNVYVSDPCPKSQGFAGRILTFKLKDGFIRLQGPWHSNSDSLLADTGLDIRDQHLTFVVISKEREMGEHFEAIMKGILYIDPEPMLGSFKRGELAAKRFANSTGQPVWCYSESQGGSSGPNLVSPDEEGADARADSR